MSAWSAVSVPSLLRAEPHGGDLVAAVVAGGHVLRAGLDPLDRPARLAGGPGAEHLLAGDLQLGAEAAADLRGDDPHLLLGDPEDHPHEQADEVRDLRGGVHGDRAGLVVGEDAAGLDRRAGDAVVDHPALDDHVGLREARVHVAAAERPLVHLVGAELLVDEVRALVQRGLDVRDDRERVVLDEDVLGGVDRDAAVGAEDDRDGVADVLDDAPGQRPVLGVVDLDALGRPGHRQRGEQVGHVLAGVDGDDVVAGLGRALVDRDDRGVGLGRADDRRVQHPGDRDVVDVGGLAGDQPRILLAAQGAADVRLARLDGAHAETPCLAAACTALTMLW